jgi:hypothetical protein
MSKIVVTEFISLPGRVLADSGRGTCRAPLSAACPQAVSRYIVLLAAR